MTPALQNLESFCFVNEVFFINFQRIKNTFYEVNLREFVLFEINGIWNLQFQERPMDIIVHPRV